MAEIAPGCAVTLEYRLLLEDGTVADEAGHDEPLHFTVGDGSMLAQLESHLHGLKTGEQVRFLLGPEEAFGFRDEENIHEMPRSEFPSEMPLDPGTVIAFAAPSGQEVPGTVSAVAGERVTVDFNHPLAGHAVTFEVKVISVGRGD